MFVINDQIHPLPVARFLEVIAEPESKNCTLLFVGEPETVCRPARAWYGYQELESRYEP